MRWPVSAFIAAVGVAACRMPAAAASTVSSRSCASASSSVTSSTPAPGTLRTPRQTASTAAGLVGQLDHELVDGHARLALEHLETDDVAVHGTDLGRHGARARPGRQAARSAFGSARHQLGLGRSVGPRHADGHPHGVLGVAGVDPLDRGHVGVVTPAPDGDVALPDRDSRSSGRRPTTSRSTPPPRRGSPP